MLSLKVPLRDAMFLKGANGPERAQIREVELPSFTEVKTAGQEKKR